MQLSGFVCLPVFHHIVYPDTNYSDVMTGVPYSKQFW